MVTEIGKLYRTEEYDIFKKLPGNRKDAEFRSRKVMESIKKNGYVLSPICVNEKHEVIDGQARLIALQEMCMPIDYYIAPGATITDCIAMNIYGTKWTTKDYIDSHADTGNENYIILQDIIRKWGAELHISVILPIIAGLYSTSMTSAIKDGSFTVDKKDLENRVKHLETLVELKNSLKWMKGNKDHFLLAYNFIEEKIPSVDISKLRSRIDVMGGQLKPAIDIKTALASLSEIYNWKLQPDNRLYFDKEYDQYLCRTMAGYRKRWSQRYS